MPFDRHKKRSTPKSWHGRYVRITDVAAKFGVTLDAVRYWIKKDKLRADMTLGGHRRILKEDFDDLVKCLPGRTGCPPLKRPDQHIISRPDVSISLIRKLPQATSLRGIPVARELAVLLKKRPRLLKVYEKMRPARRKTYCHWIMTAQKPATQKRRARQAIYRIEKYGRQHGLV